MRYSGSNVAESAMLAGLVLTADNVGLTAIDDAFNGKEFLTGRALTPADRITNGLLGSTQVVLTAVGIYGIAGSPVLQSAVGRAGSWASRTAKNLWAEEFGPRRGAVISPFHRGQPSTRVSTATRQLQLPFVEWVDETAAMSPRAFAYQSGAPGARSNMLTRRLQSPVLLYERPDGVLQPLRFDGLEGNVLIDRKVSVTTFRKSQVQALHQSEALSQTGLSGRWEVPTASAAARARTMLEKLGITNIEVRVVPE
jgi:filamentous hemagglutinin